MSKKPPVSNVKKESGTKANESAVPQSRSEFGKDLLTFVNDYDLRALKVILAKNITRADFQFTSNGGNTALLTAIQRYYLFISCCSLLQNNVNGYIILMLE